MANARRFELVRELGAGAFGTVYLAELVSSGDFRRKVALKLLNEQWDASGDAGRRLRDEARLLGRLRHRHIVQVDDLVMIGGRWAVVMEHIPGADLERLLSAAQRLGERVPMVAALEITAAIATALDAAWSSAGEGEQPLRVVHRDIKPSNVRLTADGDVKVLDFGIARADFEGREARTESVRYGSVGYMSPERLLGDPETPGGDVYGVGVVLYEMLAGRALGRSPLAPEQQIAHVNNALAELGEAQGERVAPVIPLIRALLAYEEAQRPTAHEVAARARKLARELEGEDLAAFCARMVPQVNAVLGDASREAQGYLAEQSPFDERSTLANVVALPTSSAPRQPSASPTLVVPLEAELASAPAPRGRGRMIAVALALVAVIALLLVAGPGAGPDPDAAPPRPTTDEVTVGAAPPPGEVSAPAVEAPPIAPAAAEPAQAAAEASTAATVEASAAPEQPAAPSVARTQTRSSAPSAPAVAPVPEAATAAPPATAPATAERLRAIKFAAPTATAISARCGDVSGSGTTSALLRDAPAGACTVTATVDGQALTGTVNVERPSGYTCAAEGGSLACR